MKKICFITGGNAGIGKEAAIQIAEKGFHVIIGCRNQERGTKALEDIKVTSKSNSVELVIIDMASKESINNAAEFIIEKHGVLDVLIHNAADFDISQKKPSVSPDGVENIWATNHVGPVLLTKLFLDALKKSGQGRVITIASQGLIMHPNLKVDMDDPEYKRKKFSVAKAYYQSKLAQLMFTYRLAERQKENNITANCIRVTNVQVDLGRYPNMSGFMKFLYTIKRRFSISAEEMARTYAWLAIAPECSRFTGKYFNEKKQEVGSSKYSKDAESIDKLMELTHQYL